MNLKISLQSKFKEKNVGKCHDVMLIAALHLAAFV